MASEYHNVNVQYFDDNTSTYKLLENNVQVKIMSVGPKSQFTISFFRSDGTPLKTLTVPQSSWESCRLVKQSLTLYCPTAGSHMLTFPAENHLTTFLKKLTDTTASLAASTDPISSESNTEPRLNGKAAKVEEDCSDVSLFDKRTDHWSAMQYFQFYSFLSQQQNMMQDYIRTSTYQRAILSNPADFQNKVVLDVGAGSGILSFFAVQAGARRVYAVEASSMAEHCEQLVRGNKMAGRIIVLTGKIEDITIPEPVDVLISEPMGYMLLNERMLESYVHARKFLRPGITPRMYPSVANLYVAPFADEPLYVEQISKANFWYQKSFHGVNLTTLQTSAVNEYFSQPVVDTFDIGICVSPPQVHHIDLTRVTEAELSSLDVPVEFTVAGQCSTGSIHGLAFWFDVGFLGSQREVWLGTGPTEPLTHWYQVRCLFRDPMFVIEGQTLEGRVIMKSNPRQSYDVEIELGIKGTTTKVFNKLDLKNPYFRYTGMTPQPPPGTHSTCPTEAYYARMNGDNNAAPLNGYSGIDYTTSDSTTPSAPLNISAQFMIGDYAANLPQQFTATDYALPSQSAQAVGSQAQPVTSLQYHQAQLNQTTNKSFQSF